MRSKRQKKTKNILSESKLWRDENVPPLPLAPIILHKNNEKNQNRQENEHPLSLYITSLLESIWNRNRIEALLACDYNVISYDPYSYRMIFNMRGGRNAKMILVPMIFLVFWDTFFILLFYYIPSLLNNITMTSFPDDTNEDGNNKDINDIFGGIDLVSPLLTPVSFLLVFRLSRAAVRYWDARSSLGQVIHTSRILSSTFFSTCSFTNDSSSCDESILLLVHDFARWLCVFPIIVKNFLRPDHRIGWGHSERENKKRFELGSLLTKEEIDSLLVEQKYYENVFFKDFLQNEETRMLARSSLQQYTPITVLHKLRQIIYSFTSRSTSISSSSENNHHQIQIQSMLYRQLNEQLDNLTLAWGKMERINNNPLPFIYVVHLRTFLMIYLLFWHFQTIVVLMVNTMIAHTRNWYYYGYDLLILFAASWALLGIEAASVECERPFSWYSNHLTLGKMCVVVSNNVAQALLGNIQCQIPVQKDGDEGSLNEASASL